MYLRAAAAFLLLVCAGPMILAQSTCSDCFRAAEDEMKACLKSAISIDDKTACEDRRDEELKACSNGECRLERELRQRKTDAPP